MLFVSFLTSPPVLNALFVLALFGFALAILSDHLQILAKYQGVMKRRIAGGYNLAMKVMVVNRIGAVFFFLLVAFNIDNGLAADKLAFGLAITLILLAIPTLGLVLWLQRRFYAAGLTLRVLDISSWPKTIVAATFLATAFNLLGMTVPWVAGAAFPALRLTLANSSFVFNTIFTVINVFYIEHRFAQLIDQDGTQIHGFVAGVMVARLATFLLTGIAIGLLI